MQEETNQSGRPAVSRSREEIMEAESMVSAMENTADARQAEYAIYAYDVFRWLRGDDNSILGRKLAERARVRAEKAELRPMEALTHEGPAVEKWLNAKPIRARAASDASGRQSPGQPCAPLMAGECSTGSQGRGAASYRARRPCVSEFGERSEVKEPQRFDRKPRSTFWIAPA